MKNARREDRVRVDVRLDEFRSYICDRLVARLGVNVETLEIAQEGQMQCIPSEKEGVIIVEFVREIEP